MAIYGARRGGGGGGRGRSISRGASSSAPSLSLLGTSTAAAPQVSLSQSTLSSQMPGLGMGMGASGAQSQFRPPPPGAPRPGTFWYQEEEEAPLDLEQIGEMVASEFGAGDRFGALTSESLYEEEEYGRGRRSGRLSPVVRGHIATHERWAQEHLGGYGSAGIFGALTSESLYEEEEYGRGRGRSSRGRRGSSRGTKRRSGGVRRRAVTQGGSTQAQLEQEAGYILDLADGGNTSAAATASRSFDDRVGSMIAGGHRVVITPDIDAARFYWQETYGADTPTVFSERAHQPGAFSESLKIGAGLSIGILGALAVAALVGNALR